MKRAKKLEIPKVCWICCKNKVSPSAPIYNTPDHHEMFPGGYSIMVLSGPKLWIICSNFICCMTLSTHSRYLEISLRRAFRRVNCRGKSGRRGSNPRQPAWKAGTLPLSYSRIFKQKAKEQIFRSRSGCADLNRGPHGPKPCALPTAPHPANALQQHERTRNIARI